MIDDTRFLDKRLAIGMIAAGLLAAIAIDLQLNAGVPWIANLSSYIPVLYFTFVSTIVLIPLLTAFATKYSILKLPALVWIHLSMGVMIIYFSQIYSPFTAAWSVLILISSLYFSWPGFFGSSAALVLTGVAFMLLQMDPVKEFGVVNYAAVSVLVIAITIFTSYLFMMVIKGGQKKNRELEKAQRSEMLQVTRLNTLLNSISDAVLTLNRYGRVTSQNAAAQAFFDTNQSLIGRNMDSLLGLVDVSGDEVTVRNLIDGVKSSSLRDDLSVTKEDGVHHLSLQMSRIRSTFDDDEEYGVVFIIRDITKQKTLEEEKDEFISVTSHELRTPVAIAEGSLSNLLLMQERGASGQKLRDAADQAHKQIIYLSQMINDLSTLSRAERGVGDVVEPIDVNELVENLYTKYTPEAEAKSLEFNLDVKGDLPQLETSRLYLEEILQNFITNAIKYTKEGSVTLGAQAESDTQVKFFVRDSGIGISKSDLEHIFEKFYRSEDYRTRETSGTGLGLYVVRKLADKLNTRIEVESRLNSGSTFSFVMATRTNKSPVVPQSVETEQIPADVEQETATDEMEVEPEVSESAEAK